MQKKLRIYAIILTGEATMLRATIAVLVIFLLSVTNLTMALSAESFSLCPTEDRLPLEMAKGRVLIDNKLPLKFKLYIGDANGKSCSKWLEIESCGWKEMTPFVYQNVSCGSFFYWEDHDSIKKIQYHFGAPYNIFEINYAHSSSIDISEVSADEYAKNMLPWTAQPWNEFAWRKQTPGHDYSWWKLEPNEGYVGSFAWKPPPLLPWAPYEGAPFKPQGYDPGSGS
jgi:hypothetical protein